MSALVTPAFITEDYLKAIKAAGLLDKTDVSNISTITRQMGLRNGRGYGNEHVRNFLYRQFTTTPEIVQLITGYFTKKKEILARTAALQQNLVKELTEAHTMHLNDKLS